MALAVPLALPDPAPRSPVTVALAVPLALPDPALHRDQGRWIVPVTVARAVSPVRPEPVRVQEVQVKERTFLAQPPATVVLAVLAQPEPVELHQAQISRKEIRQCARTHFVVYIRA